MQLTAFVTRNFTIKVEIFANEENRTKLNRVCVTNSYVRGLSLRWIWLLSTFYAVIRLLFSVSHRFILSHTHTPKMVATIFHHRKTVEFRWHRFVDLHFHCATCYSIFVQYWLQNLIFVRSFSMMAKRNASRVVHAVTLYKAFSEIHKKSLK